MTAGRNGTFVGTAAPSSTTVWDAFVPDHIFWMILSPVMEVAATCSCCAAGGLMDIATAGLLGVIEFRRYVKVAAEPSGHCGDVAGLDHFHFIEVRSRSRTRVWHALAIVSRSSSHVVVVVMVIGP